MNNKSQSKPMRQKIGLIYCFRTLNQLRKLKDLIRHQWRWAHQIDLARPLGELGIDEKDPHRRELIREKINHLLPIAMAAAQIANAPTGITRKETKLGTYPPEYIDAKYDIFQHYDFLMSTDKGSAQNFDMFLDALDQLIGYYSECKMRILISWINPLKWIAGILGLPITILRYMGFESNGKWTDTVYSIFIKAIWALLLAIMSVYFAKKFAILKTFLELFKGSSS
jgi:hypothetical protein